MRNAMMAAELREIPYDKMEVQAKIYRADFLSAIMEEGGEKEQLRALKMLAADRLMQDLSRHTAESRQLEELRTTVCVGMLQARGAADLSSQADRLFSGLTSPERSPARTAGRGSSDDHEHAQTPARPSLAVAAAAARPQGTPVGEPAAVAQPKGHMALASPSNQG